MPTVRPFCPRCSEGGPFALFRMAWQASHRFVDAHLIGGFTTTPQASVYRVRRKHPRVRGVSQMTGWLVSRLVKDHESTPQRSSDKSRGCGRARAWKPRAKPVRSWAPITAARTPFAGLTRRLSTSCRPREAERETRESPGRCDEPVRTGGRHSLCRFKMGVAREDCLRTA